MSNKKAPISAETPVEAVLCTAETAQAEVVPVMGRPNDERICTSIVERSNLSVRMGTRRYTRLTNAFSKKREDRRAATVLWCTWHNFGRVHKSLRMTPRGCRNKQPHLDRT